jgi:hypothetical protein
MRCLYPRCKNKPTRHHFPITRAQGGTLTVPLCDFHQDCVHDEQPNKEVVNIVFLKAPAYWMRHGLWTPEAQDIYYIALAQWEDKKKNTLYLTMIE